MVYLTTIITTIKEKIHLISMSMRTELPYPFRESPQQGTDNAYVELRMGEKSGVYLNIGYSFFGQILKTRCGIESTSESVAPACGGYI